MQALSYVRRALGRVLSPWLWGHSSAELGLGRVSYSQFGEDVLLKILFDQKRPGFYVDVGAFHPIYLSNTYALHRQGWRGLAVDANASMATLFARHRPTDTFVHSAVGSTGGTVRMAMFETGVFNCTEDQIANVPEQFRRNERMAEVPIRPLKALLDEFEVARVDFLNVDCEGSDLAILQSNDWKRWRPAVICVEDHSEVWLQSEVTQYLIGRGYQLKYRAGLSSLFVADDFGSHAGDSPESQSALSPALVHAER